MFVDGHPSQGIAATEGAEFFVGVRRGKSKT